MAGYINRTLRLFFIGLKREFLEDLSYTIPFFMRLGYVFFPIITFFFLSKLVKDSRFLRGYGGDYFAFVISGLVVMRFCNIAISKPAKDIQRMGQQGVLENFFMPGNIPYIVRVLSLYTYQMFYSLFESIFVFILAIVIFDAPLSVSGLLKAIPTLFFMSITFFPLGLIIASFVIVFKKGQSIVEIIIWLINLTGGVLFPVELFPDWLRFLCRFNPLYLGLQLVRSTVIEGSKMTGNTQGILLLIVTLVVSSIIAVPLFNLAIREAKKSGSFRYY